MRNKGNVLATGQLLTDVFVNDNSPPYGYILRDLTGNYEAGYVTFSYTQQPPPALKVGEKYYIGSNEKNFPDSRYQGWDGQYLTFRYPG